MSEPSVQTKEQELADIISKFHKEQQGHAPTCTSTILPSMAIVISTGIFSATEKDLSQSGQGQKLIQSARREQRAMTRRTIEAQVAKLLKREICRSYYDLDVRAGEQIEVYIFA